jgi:hypothetical protein
VSIDARLSKLSSVLSARERGALVLQSLKNKTPEDPAWRRTIPPGQVPEFNRYIDLMNACNSKVTFMITVIEKEVEKLELLAGWWFTMLIWRTNLAEIDFLASVLAREAITQSEYDRLVAQAADQYIPVSMLGIELADYRRAWSNDELEPMDGRAGQLVVRRDAWQRHCEQAEREIRDAVTAGALQARGSGKKLAVRSGAFDAWLGRPVKAYPLWAGGYEVLPDDRAAQVTSDRTTLSHLQDAIKRTPQERCGVDGADGVSLEAAMEGIVERIMTGIAVRWMDLRQVEIVMDEVAEDFGGEDPLKTNLREALVTSKEKLLQVRSEMAAGKKVIELQEPSEEDLELMRRLVGYA